MDLGGSTVRGFVFYKATLTRDEKDQIVQADYKNLRFALPNGPRIFVLDNEGFMHHFNYYDTRYFRSILTDPIKVELLRGVQLVPTIFTNRSIKAPDSSLEQIKKDPIFFEYQGSCKLMKNWSDENADNPFMLGIVKFPKQSSYHNRLYS